MMQIIVRLQLVLLLLVATLALGQATLAPLADLRVGCQMGQPPFADAFQQRVNATRCVGLFAELFELVANRASWRYNMTMLDTDQIDQFLEVNATKPRSDYDVIISFHTVTPERLDRMKFTIALFQTNYRFALAPKYKPHPVSLADEILREAVWYLLALLTTFAIGLAVFYFIIEHVHGFLYPDDETALLEVPLWERPMYCLGQAFETMVAAGNELAFSNQLSRSLKYIFMAFAIFILQLFGSVVTSQLTASTVAESSVDFNILPASARVATSSPALTTYLRSQFGFTVVDLPNVETFADEFFAGRAPEYDAFVAPTEEVNHLFNAGNGGARGFAVTREFSHSGTPDLKAIPLAADLDDRYVERFNLELELLRQEGTLSAKVSTILHPPLFPPPGDIPIPNSEVLGFRIYVIVFYAIALVAAAVLFVYETFINPKEKEADEADGEPKSNDDAEKADKAGDTKSEKAMIDGEPANESPVELVWKGKVYRNVPKEFAALLDTMCRSSSEEE